MRRRTFVLGMVASGVVACGPGEVVPPAVPVAPPPPPTSGVVVADPRDGEDLFAWLDRVHGGYDLTVHRQVLGAANPFKEGDQAQGIAAADEASRANARRLIAATTLAALAAHPIFEDEVVAFADAAVSPEARAKLADWTMGELVAWLLREPEEVIKPVLPGLTSDVIGTVVKLMRDDELVAVGRKIFNPLPGSQVGARGYLGARVQPNSPTDDPEDILFQVLDAFAYGVGDVVLGTNPVSSDPEQVAAVEVVLKEVLDTFGLAGILPHCVLAHVDVQAEVERRHPGSTALWFQSLAGVADANRTFDLDVAKMKAHAATRTGPYGLYFETGQGADGTNGHGKGFDMVLHESRKYGFARALKAEVAAARAAAGTPGEPWVHVNDVAGFIGPEVFRTREQLVRVCLEDTVMGKLHGLTIGLDVCSTLHMEVSLDDLTWCLDQVMPANPAYLMALPTRNDPMLSYLTTSYQDHVRIREKFGYKVDDRMVAFFAGLGVLTPDGKPGEHFGRPDYVFKEFQRRKGDQRSDEEILADAKARMERVRARGVFLAEGHGANPWDLDPALDAQVRALYEDAKKCLHTELPDGFADTLKPSVSVRTGSRDRDDYILHPPTGEQLAGPSAVATAALAVHQGGKYDAQLVISDGLDALALTDEGHLTPFLTELRTQLAGAGVRLAPEHVVVRHGRVRAGYRIGEALFSGLSADTAATLVHVIGERPGNGHHTYSAYVTRLPARVWAAIGTADHNHTKVIANIADTALDPITAARQVTALLGAF